MVGAACRSGPSTPARFSGTPLAWLAHDAEPWNQHLNADQLGVDRASRASTGRPPAAYFTDLGRACAAMAGDVGRARGIPPAPSSSLEAAWTTMLDRTADYADACVALSHHPASSKRLDAWNASLTAMDRANGGFNQAVAKVRDASASTSTTGS